MRGSVKEWVQINSFYLKDPLPPLHPSIPTPLSTTPSCSLHFYYPHPLHSRILPSININKRDYRSTYTHTVNTHTPV